MVVIDEYNLFFTKPTWILGEELTNDGKLDIKKEMKMNENEILFAITIVLMF